MGALTELGTNIVEDVNYSCLRAGSFALVVEWQ